MFTIPASARFISAEPQGSVINITIAVPVEDVAKYLIDGSQTLPANEIDSMCDFPGCHWQGPRPKLGQHKWGAHRMHQDGSKAKKKRGPYKRRKLKT